MHEMARLELRVVTTRLCSHLSAEVQDQKFEASPGLQSETLYALWLVLQLEWQELGS